MAFEWTDKQDFVDDVMAKDVNDLAHAVIEHEETINNQKDLLKSGNGSIYINNPYAQNPIGGNNTVVGLLAGYNLTEGWSNTAVGFEALKSNTTANSNTAVGHKALTANSTGEYNVAVGVLAGTNSLSGDYNTCVGYRAATFNTTGEYNVMLGGHAGVKNTMGSNNTYVGFEAGHENQEGTGNVCIGHKAGYNEAGNNKLYIANSETADPLIYGEFDNKKVKVNGDIATRESGIIIGSDLAPYYFENFEKYSVSPGSITTKAGWSGTADPANNLSWGFSSTRFLAVKPAGTLAKVMFKPVPVNSAAKAFGRNAKIIAQYRIARTNAADSNWHYFAFADSNAISSINNNQTGAALCAGHRPADVSANGQWLYRSSFTGDISTPYTNVIKDGTYSQSAGQWTTIKYVVSVTNADGNYITPVVDIYVDDSPTPVLTGKSLLNNVSKIDCLVINSVTGTKTYYVDDILVKVVSDGGGTAVHRSIGVNTETGFEYGIDQDVVIGDKRFRIKSGIIVAVENA